MIKTKAQLKTQNDTYIYENINEEITGQIMHDHLEDIIDSMRDSTSINLDDLGDVNASTPTDGQVLQYSGGTWNSSTVTGLINYWTLSTGALYPSSDVYGLNIGPNNVYYTSGLTSIVHGNTNDMLGQYDAILASYDSQCTPYAQYSAVIAGSGITEAESFTLHTTYLKLLGGVKADGITGNTWVSGTTDNYLATKGYVDYSVAGVSTSPGGSHMSIQLNSGGTFYGTNSFEYDYDQKSLSIDRYSAAPYSIGSHNLIINGGGSEATGDYNYIHGSSNFDNDSSYSILFGTANQINGGSGCYYNYLIGTTNTITNLTNASNNYMFGNSQTITNEASTSSYNFLFGYTNVITQSASTVEYNYILGYNNTIKDSSNVYVLGNNITGDWGGDLSDNTTYIGTGSNKLEYDWINNNILINKSSASPYTQGSGNFLINQGGSQATGTYSLLIGASNVPCTSNYSTMIGTGLYLHDANGGSQYNTLLGTTINVYCTSGASGFNLIKGSSITINNTSSSQYNSIFGDTVTLNGYYNFNTINSSNLLIDSATLFSNFHGSNNTISATTTTSFTNVHGSNNTLDSNTITFTSVFGQENDIESYEDRCNFVFGEYNKIINTGDTTNRNTNMIFGYGNEMYEAINSIALGYQNKIMQSTSSTYFGYVIGKNNNLRLSYDDCFIIGDTNTSIENTTLSYVFGRNNLISGNTTAYVVGQNNVVGQSMSDVFIVGHGITANDSSNGTNTTYVNKLCAVNEVIVLGHYNVEGSWKFVKNGNDLEIQCFTGGTYVTKETWTA